jgi:hypothetical protein
MRRLFTSILALSLSFGAMANDPQLVVQRLDNHGQAGTTYRLYAQLASPSHTLHVVFGDTQNPLTISSTAPFYQAEAGSHTSAVLTPLLQSAYPTTKYDSWVTLGAETSANNSTWDLGIDFSSFENGGTLTTNNGGWYAVSTHSSCTPNSAGLVLIAQFTSTGVVTGTLNLEGWVTPLNKWTARALTFSTDNAQTFGCKDASAANYLSAATFEDGSCIYEDQNANNALSITTVSNLDTEWEIFPNPLRNELLNIQFSTDIALTSENTMVEIYDMAGKKVASHQLNAGNIVGGNRVSLPQSLSGGAYKVVLIQKGKATSKTLVVAH